MSKKISHVMELDATPSQVYNTIINSEEHTKLTGAPAKFQPKVDGIFSTFNGAIKGRIADLIENERIELEWRADAFPEGFFTKAVFDLEATESGTKLSFTHEGVPDEAHEMIKKGWETNYWENLETYFSS